jgi:two-component system response regulator FlrC
MFDYDDGELGYAALELPAPAAPAQNPVSALGPVAAAPSAPGGCLLDARDAHERSTIEAALRATASRAEAAERLGISPRTLRYRMARLRERGHAIPRAS